MRVVEHDVCGWLLSFDPETRNVVVVVSPSSASKDVVVSCKAFFCVEDLEYLEPSIGALEFKKEILDGVKFDDGHLETETLQGVLDNIQSKLRAFRLPFVLDDRKSLVLLGGQAVIRAPYNVDAIYSSNSMLLGKLQDMMSFEMSLGGFDDSSKDASNIVFKLPKVTTKGAGDFTVAKKNKKRRLKLYKHVLHAGCTNCDGNTKLFNSSILLGYYSRYSSYNNAEGEAERESLGLPAQFGTRSNEKESGKVKRSTLSVSDSKGCPDGVPMKFWVQRYRLFCRYDEGIQLDPELWYSVTPEAIAEHVAERCRCDCIVDAFCGAGGNAIQFAFTCERVIAIDIDPKKLKCAIQNAKVYGVYDRIEFILGDCTKILPYLRKDCVDAVFLAPPWGGIDYEQQGSFDLKTMLVSECDGFELFRIARDLSPNVAILLPRNVKAEQCASMLGNSICEFEQHFVTRGKVKTCCVYYGNLKSKKIEKRL